MAPTRLGNAVREQREALGLNRHHVAIRLGYAAARTSKAMRRIEALEKEGTEDESFIEGLCDTLGIDAAEARSLAEADEADPRTPRGTARAAEERRSRGPPSTSAGNGPARPRPSRPTWSSPAASGSMGPRSRWSPNGRRARRRNRAGERSGSFSRRCRSGVASCCTAGDPVSSIGKERRMGLLYAFRCPACGYRAEVAGGESLGWYGSSITILCRDCRELHDVPRRARDRDTVAERELPVVCPRSDHHVVEEWGAERACPKCGASMDQGEVTACWD